ncbi:MauE/DoxX family redox-associated membrane protein [Cecembia rubra]|uniref:MauE/DoxX family redox-associated membrane protein n=1 Tax=Cecembia rubra TaxID=1485585 RepID=UPI0039C8EE3C
MKYLNSISTIALSFLLFYSALEKIFNFNAFIIGIGSGNLIPSYWSYYLAHIVVGLKGLIAILVFVLKRKTLVYFSVVILVVFYMVVYFTTNLQNCGCSLFLERINPMTNQLILIFLLGLSLFNLIREKIIKS